jgi:myo-inositol catabolism protein IolS
VAMGGCPIGGHGWGHVDDAESVAAVRRAVELGVNFFDTADVYGLGHSEQILAQALGPKRREVVIATKFGVRSENGRTWKDASPGYLRSALDASLRRLQIDCIPLYYVHWPDEKTPVADTMAELARCRQQGKIRGIGLSNFSAAQVREAAAVAPVEALQVQFSLVDRLAAAELLPLARELGTTLLTWGSLAQGLLTGKYDARSTFVPEDRRRRYDNFRGAKFAENLRAVERLRAVATSIGRTPAQVALRWLLDTPGVCAVLFGAKRPTQVDENVASAGWRLSASDYQALDTWEIFTNKGAKA